MDGIIQPSAMSYKECIRIVGAGHLTYAGGPYITAGRKFLKRADGSANAPHCPGATVEKRAMWKYRQGIRRTSIICAILTRR